jgi:hypothetical protein
MRRLPLLLILFGVGITLLSFIFGRPEYPLAGFHRQMEDMRVFGIELLQFKWILAGSICLILTGIYLQFRKPPISN